MCRYPRHSGKKGYIEQECGLFYGEGGLGLGFCIRLLKAVVRRVSVGLRFNGSHLHGFTVPVDHGDGPANEMKASAPHREPWSIATSLSSVPSMTSTFSLCRIVSGSLLGLRTSSVSR